VTVRPRRSFLKGGASPFRPRVRLLRYRRPTERGGEREQLLRMFILLLSVTRGRQHMQAPSELEPRPHEPRYIVTVHGSGYQLLL
jgi:hypothetical protein